MKEFKRGDMILAHLKGQGSVQNGLRPCIVVGRDELNRTSPCLKVVPVTGVLDRESITHIRLTKDMVEGNDVLKPSTILCEQEQNIDKSQFVGKWCGKVRDEIMEKVNEGLMYTLGLS